MGLKRTKMGRVGQTQDVVAGGFLIALVFRRCEGDSQHTSTLQRINPAHQLSTSTHYKIGHLALLTLFQILAQIPLSWMQSLGACAGLLVWLLSPSYRKQFNRNADLAQLSTRSRWLALMNTGSMVAELPWVWCRPLEQDILKHVDWVGEEHLHKAFEAGKGVIVLSPHLGCWEIGAQILAARFGPLRGPMVALYRPPRKKWLAPLVEHARAREHLHTVPTTATGVREILRTLKRGGMTALLPDQVPPLGQGVWVNFLSQPAYTMTLAMKLAHQTQATVLMGWCERLPGARFRGHFYPMPATSNPKLTEEALDRSSRAEFDITQATQAMNQAIEEMILANASQYLWGYARFKQPREVGVSSTPTHSPKEEH
jgi:KDO2-lipid IV(A) lauroyltransferase